MKRWFRSALALALSTCLYAQTIPGGAAAPSREISILQIRILEGEGGVHRVGTRATQPITVQVTDETGKPVDHVSVSFHLPETGPGGLFPSGLKSEIAITDGEGKAAVFGMRWNGTAGPFQMRITAVRDQARAGIVVAQYLTDPVKVNGTAKVASQPRHHISGKWIALIGVVGAAGGLAVGFSHAGAAASTPAPAASPVTIGAPIVTIGLPR